MKRKLFLQRWIKLVKTTPVILWLVPTGVTAREIRTSRPAVDPETPVYTSEQVKTVSGHLLYFNLIGLSYGYECAVASRGTIILTGGWAYYYTPTVHFESDPVHWIKGSLKNDHLFAGQIGFEPRFYYNLRKRQRKGFRTFGNSGGYLSARLEYVFPIAGTGSMTKDMQFFGVVPYWGARRVWRHFLLDVSGGFGYVRFINGFSGTYFSLRLGLGIRL